MSRKRDNRARPKAVKPRANSTLGFSNERFLELLTVLTGIQPVGEFGRETPLDLTDLASARGSLLLRELYSKYDDGKPSLSKEETTWKRFHEAELQCQETNRRFYELANRNPFWVCVRRRIWTLLGKFSWDEAAKGFGHGPGGTTRLTRAQAFAAYKYSGTPESTSGNAILATCAIASVPLWKQSVLFEAEDPETKPLVAIVEGNSVITVPKNYKTHRTIAKEPCMNVYIQKGIGRMIRRRLKRVGVDLDDQTRNQMAALTGSLTGALATMDLSMASDTLAREVVSWLLPNDWWYALEQCRSLVGVLPSGETINYQKFSSMGNGFTFELESLIFWAITQQVCCSDVQETDASVCVYGDDIVVPSIHFETLAERLGEAGFTPNLKKSFATGLFRESCGKQYYAGADVTPFYVRREVKHLDRLFLVHNNVYRWGVRTGVDVSEICASLRKLAPSSWREPRLPDGFGDGAFIGDVDELRLDSHRFGWEYWQVNVLAQSSIELQNDLPTGQLIASLNALSTRAPICSKDLATRLRVIRRNQKSRYLTVLEPAPFNKEIGPYTAVCPNWATTMDLELPYIDEALSGLPARAGRFEEIQILIPQYPC